MFGAPGYEENINTVARVQLPVNLSCKSITQQLFMERFSMSIAFVHVLCCLVPINSKDQEPFHGPMCIHASLTVSLADDLQMGMIYFSFIATTRLFLSHLSVSSKQFFFRKTVTIFSWETSTVKQSNKNKSSKYECACMREPSPPVRNILPGHERISMAETISSSTCLSEAA